jgi:hypothetical protein
MGILVRILGPSYVRMEWYLRVRRGHVMLHYYYLCQFCYLFLSCKEYKIRFCTVQYKYKFAGNILCSVLHISVMIILMRGKDGAFVFIDSEH